MKKILMKAMMTSISEVMETMFFLPIEFGEKSLIGQSGIDKPMLASQLNFSGDIVGSLCIIAPKDLVAEMAENFMGEPQDTLTEEHISGTLTEMLNMVCGNALSKTESKQPFELGIPEMIDETKISEKEIVSLIETSQSRMAIHLHVD